MLFLIGYIYYIIDLIIVYKSGIDRVRYYKIHNYVDDIIGKGFYRETKAEITKMYIGFVSFFILSYLNNFVIKAIYEESVFAIILNFLDLYNSFFILVSLLDQISTITQLKNRLKHMGDVLEAYANCRYTMPGSFEEEIPSEKFKSSRTMMKKKLNSLKCLKDCRYFEILWFKKCYLMMLEQVDYINTLFGLKGLIGILMLLFFIVALFNNFICGYYLNIVMYLCICCEGSYRQAERIVRTADLLITNKIISEELKLSLKELRDAVQSRPVLFHAMHFFRFDYRLLVSIASVSVTYIVICYQNFDYGSQA
ncbi:hypothetical protein ABMA27_006278 [Loxostege sticticalis]|uniref:Gustatory receptor n=1 Tax=Loxostege sticticalis TaxID=481309 RepID=A0ABR3HI79_LOXSC